MESVQVHQYSLGPLLQHLLQRAGRGCISDPFVTTSGVQMACVAMPNLFKVDVDYWVKNVTERCPNLRIDFHSCFTDLCSVYNVVIFATHLDIIAELLELLPEEASPLGLTCNWARTKIQSLSEFPQQPPQAVTINNEQVEVISDFVYSCLAVLSVASRESGRAERSACPRRCESSTPVWFLSSFMCLKPGPSPPQPPPPGWIPPDLSL